MEKANSLTLMDKALNFIIETSKHFYKTITVHSRGMKNRYNRHGLACGDNILYFMLCIVVGIFPMSTIVSMFTNHKDWNDTLVRDFIRKWYFV